MVEALCERYKIQPVVVSQEVYRVDHKRIHGGDFLRGLPQGVEGRDVLTHTTGVGNWFVNLKEDLVSLLGNPFDKDPNT